MARTTKRFWSRFALATVAAASIPLMMPVLAASHPGGKRGGDAHMVKALEKNAERLGIDAATLDQIRATMESRREQTRAIQQARRQEGKVLRELLEQPTPDRAAIMSQIELVGQLGTDLRKQRMETWLEIRSLLTPEQRSELSKLRSEHRKERRGRFRGHHGTEGGDADREAHHTFGVAPTPGV